MENGRARMIILKLTEKEAAAVHALYSIGTDAVFLCVDPSAVRSCAAILSRFDRDEVRVIRDKFTKLGDDISLETLQALNITRVKNPSFRDDD
jgi:hypothetical protein